MENRLLQEQQADKRPERIKAKFRRLKEKHLPWIKDIVHIAVDIVVDVILDK